MTLSRRRFLAGAAATAAAAHPAAAHAARASRSKRTGLPDPATITAADPADLSLVECASLLQARKLSSVELTQACLARSRARDGATTAWIHVYPEYAMALAKAADERLSPANEHARRRKTPLVAGIPIALKDLYAARGLPVTASSRVLAGNIATGDSTVWHKLRQAGMVLLGHSHTDEFAIGVGTPQVGNPWDPKRSPGGSSGGSGALLGARLVPAATGTDTGGSLRLPATACGITALKPSFGRVSTYGVIPCLWTRDHAGPMGRSAADCSLLLGYMAGPDEDDPSTLTAPPVPAAGYPIAPTKGSKPYAGKRFGVVKGSADKLPGATAKLFARFLDEVRGLGGDVRVVEMPKLPAAGTGTAELAEAGLYHEQFLPGSVGKYRAEYQALVVAGAAAQAAPVSEYLTLQRDRVRFMHEYNELFAREGLACVVYPGSTVDGATREDLLGLTFLSGSVPGDVGWANYAGCPAICTPAGRSEATGMPFGVQLGVLPWREADALQLAIDHQAAHPYWRDAPKPLESTRDLPTVAVVDPPPHGHPDPTGTDAKHPAFQIVPTLSTQRA